MVRIYKNIFGEIILGDWLPRVAAYILELLAEMKKKSGAAQNTNSNVSIVISF